MNIVIAGAGEVGTHLASMLSQNEHNIVLLDNQPSRLKYADTHLEVLTIIGSCSSIHNLKQATVHKSDLFIGVTESEEKNLTACIFAKNLGAKKVIARVDNAEHIIPKHREYLYKLGIDELVYPEQLAANKVVSSLKITGASHVHEFSNGKLILFQLTINNRSKILGSTIKDLTKSIQHHNYTLVAIKRGDRTIIPKAHHRFFEGDHVYIISKPRSIKKVIKLCGGKQFDIHNIMIVGGSRIGIKTAMLLENNFNVKLLEIDKEKCTDISNRLSKTLIINGDGRNLEILKEEGIRSMDAFVAVTGSPEVNIFSSLLAKKMGVRHEIIEIENIDFIDLAQQFNIGTIFNKKLIAASYIYKFTTTKSEILDFKELAEIDADVVEFVVKPKSKVTRNLVKALNFPEAAIIGGLIRNGVSYIVNGDMQIKANDEVVVFTKPKEIRKVEKFFN